MFILILSSLFVTSGYKTWCWMKPVICASCHIPSAAGHSFPTLKQSSSVFAGTTPTCQQQLSRSSSLLPGTTFHFCVVIWVMSRWDTVSLSCPRGLWCVCCTVWDSDASQRGLIAISDVTPPESFSTHTQTHKHVRREVSAQRVDTQGAETEARLHFPLLLHREVCFHKAGPGACTQGADCRKEDAAVCSSQRARRKKRMELIALVTNELGPSQRGSSHDSQTNNFTQLHCVTLTAIDAGIDNSFGRFVYFRPDWILQKRLILPGRGQAPSLRSLMLSLLHWRTDSLTFA